MNRQIIAIIRKELSGYFGSPLALIFMGTFLAAVLFIFFTTEAFFARGLADVRPLFNWMPLLLVLLLAALTMRQWSEEQRSGTEELLLTLPVSHISLVLGKFLAVMAMIALALVLTLPLPISVALMSNLDWGPVIGGYLASLLMASAYAAIGLFASSRTDNQIVALISTALLGGLFYLIGTPGLVDFFGGNVAEILRALGTGSRFESVQRGVIDLRDLIYYLSLTTVFLVLNAVSIDSLRWSVRQNAYKRRVFITTALILTNIVLLNVWIFGIQGLRLDLTADKEFSLSDTTVDMFEALEEPLLIRAYVSDRGHPLLVPLVPQIRDMLREYEVRSGGKVTAEIVDPAADPELEAEANQNYGIQPVPFQVSDRYEASVINAYFDILVRYGDQNVVLTFQDLIQVDVSPGGELDVHLRSLEYDLTRSVKKVVYGFQSIDAILAKLDQPAELTFFISSTTLPQELAEAQLTISKVAGEIAADSSGKFSYKLVDLDSPEGSSYLSLVTNNYGLQPIPVGIFSSQFFYAHMVLESGDEAVVLYPPAELSEIEIRLAIESALKRTSSGFLKVVGIRTPPAGPDGQQAQFSSYNLLREQLSREYTIRSVDLSSGSVPQEIDVLLVLGPSNLLEAELFALDQFLMRGGALTLAMSSFQLVADQYSGGLSMAPAGIGNIAEWLRSHAIGFPAALLMDKQNQPFPMPVMREVAGFQVEEIQAVDYPFFVYVGPDGLDSESVILANVPAVTLNWATPIELFSEKLEDRETTVLLTSSAESWLQSSPVIQPDFALYPLSGFAEVAFSGSRPLAISMQGRFPSYFQGRSISGIEGLGPRDSQLQGHEEELVTSGPHGVIPSSPESSRLVVVGSATFIEDSILGLSSQLAQEQYLNNLLFAQNIVDWSAEDLDLLELRSTGSAARLLPPMEREEQTSWEIGNYLLTIVLLLGVYLWRRVYARSEQPLPLPVGTSGHGEEI